MSDASGSWAEVAALRQGLYRFFAGALLPPDLERLDVLMLAAELLTDLGVDDFTFAGPWHELEERLDAVSSVEQVEAEYVRLFVAGAEGPLSPPTESHYAATEGACGGGTVTAAIRTDYAAIGLELGPDVCLQADHVAVELDAMASLCHKEAHDWEEGTRPATVATLRREWTFLDRHLARWLPDLATRVRATEPGGFYSAVVDAADAFVRHDHELVGLLAAGDRTGR